MMSDVVNIDLAVKASWFRVRFAAACAVSIVSAFALAVPLREGVASTLEESLRLESAERLAADARRMGDPKRGAILFYQPYMACRKCHAPDAEGNRIGPELGEWKERVTDAEIVEAVLHPSKRVRKGYETIRVRLESGRVVVGLKVDDGDPLVLRDGTAASKIYSIPRSEIDVLQEDRASLMPEGLANQLASRSQFLDLVSYLLAVRDGGLDRVRDLEPPPQLYAERPIPEYEQRVDHRGLIGSWNDKSLERGKAIYERVCMNCHGTHDQVGSLPTALRFAEGTLKNGADPYAMYQTITRGFGMMLPQTWMVPQQKYDVIHYIREAYFRSHNRSQYFGVTKKWLAGLPEGDTRGPRPRPLEPWSVMDYGPTLSATYEIGSDGSNFAYKGIAIRLDGGAGGIARGSHFAIFDHDTMRLAGVWSGEGFVDWEGVLFNGKHAVHPRIVGTLQLENRGGPGWAEPSSGSWEDVRLKGRDGRRYGPLPREWAHYEGLVRDGDRTVIEYRIGDTLVRESVQLIAPEPRSVYVRQFQLAAHGRPLTLQVGDLGGAARFELRNGGRTAVMQRVESTEHGERKGQRVQPILVAGIVDLGTGKAAAEWSVEGGRLRLTLGPTDRVVSFGVWFAALDELERLADIESTARSYPLRAIDPSLLNRGGSRLFGETLTTTPMLGEESEAFAVDVIRHPADNPWQARTRFTGFDFLGDGDSVAICSWDGDVWLVRGIKQLSGAVSWRRIASGLFQPLGLKVVGGRIYVTCRDQIVRLDDLNGDGEIDRYTSFNSDHQVTEHFHEFAMGLQTDREGNFYYAKSARHALPALVPHHGTLLKVSADGNRTEIVARGFRAANGVCLNPDGSFLVTDQEGHWTPKNRINWVRRGGFYGNMMGYHDVTDSSDSAMELPLCWITNEFDRSPSELLWIPRDTWGALGGGLLSLSYGYGKIFTVLHEEVAGRKQGVMCALPIEQFPTGLLRGRFHPQTGALYTCGMMAWGSNQPAAGGFYRIRATGKPMHLPVEFHATADGITLSWSDRLDRASAENADNWRVMAWNLKRSAQYGSKHLGERRWNVESVEVSPDGKQVCLRIPEIAPTWGLSIRCFLKTSDGRPLKRRIDGSIYELGK